MILIDEKLLIEAIEQLKLAQKDFFVLSTENLINELEKTLRANEQLQ